MIANLRLLKIPKLPLIRGGMTVGLIFSVAMALYLVSWYIESGAVRNMNFDLSKVYDYRELTSDITNIGVLAYLNSWTYNVFCLFIISYALLKRKYVLLLMAILAQIFYFSVSGHKSILFYPFIIFGIYYYFSKASSLLIMPLVFIAVVVTSLLAYYYFGHIFSASLFIRRLFFVPALLTYHYFDFFSYQPHVYWSNSFLSSFLSYPYATSIPKVIGEFNGSGSSANNGYISSGYAHAGLWGVFAYTIILGIILRFVDVVSRRCEALWFALVMTVVPLRNLLISSDLFTVMLTHGLIIAIVLLLLVRGQKNA